MANTVTTENISFIRASQDSPVFYYCAAAPTLTRHDDGTPVVRLQIYRRSGDKQDIFYASLMLQTELSSTYAEAEAAARHNPEIPPGAPLLPLQVIACSATLNIPQIAPKQTADASLGGLQRCYLLTRLNDPAQIQLLAALMRDPASVPVAVSYKVDYLQALPPATFELVAKWEEVYRYVQTAVGFNIFIAHLGIDDIASQLISQRLVQIKTRDTDPNGHIAEAGRELTQILIAEFFTPVFAPPQPETPPAFGFYLQQLTVADFSQRSLSASLTTTTVVKRSIFPQARFAELISGSDYQAQDAIVMTDLQDDFFSRRRVNVNLLNPRLDDNIQLVAAALNYGTDSASLLFRRDKPDTQPFSAPSQLDPQTHKMLWPVSYSFTVYLAQSVGGISSITSSVMETSLDDIYLDIESLCCRYDFTLEAVSDFNWQWYRSVLVTLNYSLLPDGKIFTAKSFRLSRETPGDSYPLLLPDPDRYQFSVTCQYTPEDNSPHIPVSRTQPTGQDVLVFSRLYPQRQLRLEAGFDWQKVDQALVFVGYGYAPDAPMLRQTFTFNADNPAPQEFSADSPDPLRRLISLEVFISYLPGQSEQDREYTTTTDADYFDIANYP